MAGRVDRALSERLLAHDIHEGLIKGYNHAHKLQDDIKR
jgi:hypothetical protein